MYIKTQKYKLIYTCVHTWVFKHTNSLSVTLDFDLGLIYPHTVLSALFFCQGLLKPVRLVFRYHLLCICELVSWGKLSNKYFPWLIYIRTSVPELLYAMFTLRLHLFHVTIPSGMTGELRIYLNTAWLDVIFFCLKPSLFQ